MFKYIIDKYSKEILDLNDYMADNPEISGEEYESSRKIVEVLSSHGLEVVYPYSGLKTSFKATINKGKERKAAVLVEYDALRGLGHACGHCASGSISILAALVLNDIKDSIDAQIDIIGTPDEEMHGSKATMANMGVFDEYDFAIMIHMSKDNYIFSKSLALDAYDFIYRGKPAHAAGAPWEGKNALNGLRLFLSSIDMMRQHVKDDVRIHGIIKEGGVAANIVPDYVRAELSVRSLERSYLNEVSDWVMDCAKAAALATKTEVEVIQIGEKYNEQINNTIGSQLLEDIYSNLGIETVDNYELISGSSDIGNVDYICPVMQPYLSIGEEYGLHTEEFAQAMKNEKTHEAILKGGEIIASFITTIYEDIELLNKMKEEHRQKRNI